MNDDKHIWFARRYYGWGWGMPTCWQGWAVLLGYILAVAGLDVLFRATDNAWLFYAGMGLSTIVLLIFCFRHGERPAWRWGRD